jgi:hypothetical protein
MHISLILFGSLTFGAAPSAALDGCGAASPIPRTRTSSQCPFALPPNALLRAYEILHFAYPNPPVGSGRGSSTDHAHRGLHRKCRESPVAMDEMGVRELADDAKDGEETKKRGRRILRPKPG